MNEKQLTSIIIPAHNGWKFTQLCIRSIRTYTDHPYEIILIDNGSTERMPARLREINDLTLIQNDWNKGFAGAMNQGLASARGEFLVWLNNDTLPSHRWLEQLIKVLNTRPKAGLVGPLSNCVIPEQKIKINMQSVSQIHRFSQHFNQSNPNKWKKSRRLSGFCIALTREVFERVGFLDERFGLGTYEDDDYCYRVIEAGYDCIIAGDTYLHHFGSRSFRKRGYREFKWILEQNRKYYICKWNQLPVAEQNKSKL
ncbi:glycosyltransferase family 2 protein [Hazenella sp. IB182357]|uniref:Glycosyltransferase family 2 protein n=1 Tax=Polycladospora coralii TaxID=2771432 RepID=A0A926N890_9BACL|nr:glycosyltransferase family 2 protein [Polycladospora coralii]MBD1371572.1 glycosyltransferase family 2 protein [Polycladospora coralii]MBS7529040.1 glycosyltransferase family 2 protein [Polycladospora coralii]